MESTFFSQILKVQFLSVITVLLTVGAIAHMLSTRRKPKSMIAWILVILTMPQIGIPLYIVFSGRKIEKSILKKGQLALHNYTPSAFRSEMSLFLTAQGIPPPTGRNEVTVCHNGVEAWFELVRMIEHAERSIYISTYILGDDEVTRELIDMLAHKALQGVEVKLLIDSLGSISLEMFPSMLRKLQDAGGEYRFFNSFMQNPIEFKMNLRNHRKSIIIDGRYVMSGGMNIAKEYMSATYHAKLWSDLSFVIHGEATRHYLDIFRFDWEYTTGETIETEVIDFSQEKTVENFVQVVPSGPDVENDAYFEAMVYMPFVAKERIWIVTPYFAPDQTILDGLIVARHRGVEIKIIVPDTSDHYIIDIARNGFLRQLQEEGIEIYLFKNRMLHAKAILVDDAFVVMGSANFDERSFFYNYETTSFFYNHRQIADIEEWMKRHMLECTVGLAKAGRVRMMFENIFKMLSPVI